MMALMPTTSSWKYIDILKGERFEETGSFNRGAENMKMYLCSKIFYFDMIATPRRHKKRRSGRI